MKTVLLAISTVAAMQASIISSTNMMSSSVNYNGSAFNDAATAKVRYWDEQQNFVLTSALALDSSLPDPTKTYANGASKTVDINAGAGPVLSKGTHVNSYYFYFEPAGTQNIVATVTFSANVLGVFVHTSSLAGSDFLRAAGPYPKTPAFNNRGMELGKNENLKLSANRRTLTLTLNASNPGDQIRVLTALDAAPVPEPSTLTMAGLAIAGLAVRLLRRR